MENDNNPIVFFDGVCNLCNSAVNFIIKRNKKENLKFSSLQSRFTEKKLQNFDLLHIHPDSFLFLENGKLYDQSSAALKTLKHLKFPWPLFSIFLIIPKPIRNFVYRIIARNRYKCFGKRESCMVPDERIRVRFLD